MSALEAGVFESEPVFAAVQPIPPTGRQLAFLHTVIDNLAGRQDRAAYVLEALGPDVPVPAMAKEYATAHGYESVKFGQTVVEHVVDELNLAAITHYRQPIVRRVTETQALSVDPCLVDEYQLLRERLAPEAPAIEATALIAPTDLPVYEVAQAEGVAPTRQFMRVAERANRLTDHLTASKVPPYPTKTRWQNARASLEILADVPAGVAQPHQEVTERIQARKAMLATEDQAILPGHVTAMVIKGLSDTSATYWLGEPLVTIRHMQGKDGGKPKVVINAINKSAVDALVQQVEEAAGFAEQPSVTIDHRAEHRLTMRGFEPFVFGQESRLPRIGQTGARECLTVLAELELLPSTVGTRAEARGKVLRESLVDYLDFLGIVQPKTAKTTNLLNELQGGSRTPMTFADLSRAACLGTNTSAFFRETDDPDTARTSIETCHTCDVREACLNEAIDNRYREGIWGGYNFASVNVRKRLQNQRATELAALAALAEQAAVDNQAP